MHYINSSCICLYTAGDDVLCKFTLTLRSPQVLRKHKVPFSDPGESELKKTSMVLWAVCKADFGGDPEVTLSCELGFLRAPAALCFAASR